MRIGKQKAVALSRAMGWFSIGLGVVEVLGAKPIARWLGVPSHAGKIRGFGLRELQAGWSILRSDVPKPGQLLSRVLGDAMDLAALGAAARSDGARSGPLAFATAAVVGATALDVVALVGLAWGEEGGAVADAASEAAVNAEKVADIFPMPTPLGVG